MDAVLYEYHHKLHIGQLEGYSAVLVTAAGSASTVAPGLYNAAELRVHMS